MLANARKGFLESRNEQNDKVEAFNLGVCGHFSLSVNSIKLFPTRKVPIVHKYRGKYITLPLAANSVTELNLTKLPISISFDAAGGL